VSTIVLPSAFRPSRCVLRLSVNQRADAAPFGGSEQAIDLLNDRWKMTCDLPVQTEGNGAILDAFDDSMRGMVNTVALYNFARPYPRGTARGTMTLNASALQGAGSIEITGCSPSTGTILYGDMLGVGGLLLKAAADATAVAGVITVTLTNRLRTAQSSGAAVTWSRPTCPFRLLSSTGISFQARHAGASTFEFGEAI